MKATWGIKWGLANEDKKDVKRCNISTPHGPWYLLLAWNKIEERKKKKKNKCNGRQATCIYTTQKKKRTKKDIKDAISILLWHVKKQLLNNSPWARGSPSFASTLASTMLQPIHDRHVSPWSGRNWRKDREYDKALNRRQIRENYTHNFTRTFFSFR